MECSGRPVEKEGGEWIMEGGYGWAKPTKEEQRARYKRGTGVVSRMSGPELRSVQEELQAKGETPPGLCHVACVLA